MRDLSVIIPARNEEWLNRTVQDILANRQADTEIIIVLDGSWPVEPIADHERVQLIYHPVSVGQRAAINEAACLSDAKYVMKLDAHCSVAPGFDVALMQPYETGEIGPNVTTVPRMYNLHVFDWKCGQCGKQTYQGPRPAKCEACGNVTDFERMVIWKPRLNRRSDSMRFDHELHFQYWGSYGHRPEAKGELAPLMSLVGACRLMTRKRFWQLEGMDEAHGSWGQEGTEVACKSWLSGGRMIVNKRTWFAHLFRTQPGFGFPYPMSGQAQDRAREHSRWLWMGNNWPGQVRPLEWLIDTFAPIPGWHEPVGAEALAQVRAAAREFERRKSNGRESGTKTDRPRTGSIACECDEERGVTAGRVESDRRGGYPVGKISQNVGVIYYTDNRLSETLADIVRRQIKRGCNGHEVVSVSLKPITFGVNVLFDGERGILTLFRQILAGLEASTADVVFFCEHDILYHPCHFDFVPPDRRVVYYNKNVWHVRTSDGHALFYKAKRLSQLCAYRDILLTHYRERVRRVEAGGYSSRIGFEPGSHHRPERIDDLTSEYWVSEFPNIDLKHGGNLTPARWSQDKFRDRRNCRGWQESDSVPGWGKTLGRMDEFLTQLEAQHG